MRNLTIFKTINSNRSQSRLPGHQFELSRRDSELFSPVRSISHAKSEYITLLCGRGGRNQISSRGNKTHSLRASIKV